MLNDLRLKVLRTRRSKGGFRWIINNPTPKSPNNSGSGGPATEVPPKKVADHFALYRAQRHDRCAVIDSGVERIVRAVKGDATTADPDRSVGRSDGIEF